VSEKDESAFVPGLVVGVIFTLIAGMIICALVAVHDDRIDRIEKANERREGYEIGRKEGLAEATHRCTMQRLRGEP
jgi:hypothetical protein